MYYRNDPSEYSLIFAPQHCALYSLNGTVHLWFLRAVNNFDSSTVTSHDKRH